MENNRPNLQFINSLSELSIYKYQTRPIFSDRRELQNRIAI